jgi:hypothetical protein
MSGLALSIGARAPLHNAPKGAAMPNDSTPLGDAMTHRFPDQKIPAPKAGPHARDEKAPTGMAGRPALPDHPERMAADIEDEEADPVIDSGPGIADGPARLKKPGG